MKQQWSTSNTAGFVSRGRRRRYSSWISRITPNAYVSTRCPSHKGGICPEGTTVQRACSFDRWGECHTGAPSDLHKYRQQRMEIEPNERLLMCVHRNECTLRWPCAAFCARRGSVYPRIRITHELLPETPQTTQYLACRFRSLVWSVNATTNCSGRTAYSVPSLALGRWPTYCIQVPGTFYKK